VGTLEPGQSVVGTGAYPVTSAGVARGHVDNTARAMGTGPKGQSAEATSNTVRIELPQEPAVLAHTGADIVPIGFGALSLLAAGLLLLALRARRRPAR
jgi:hypothetical protein